MYVACLLIPLSSATFKLTSSTYHATLLVYVSPPSVLSYTSRNVTHLALSFPGSTSLTSLPSFLENTPPPAPLSLTSLPSSPLSLSSTLRNITLLPSLPTLKSCHPADRRPSLTFPFLLAVGGAWPTASCTAAGYDAGYAYPKKENWCLTTENTDPQECPAERFAECNPANGY